MAVLSERGTGDVEVEVASMAPVSKAPAGRRRGTPAADRAGGARRRAGSVDQAPDQPRRADQRTGATVRC